MRRHFSRRKFLLSGLGLVAFSRVARAAESSIENNVIENADVTKFLMIGDTGTSDGAQYRVARALVTFSKSHPAELLLMLGDNFYNFGVKSVDDELFESAFETPYGPLGLPCYPVLGNHDYGTRANPGNVQAQVEYTRHSNIWKMPARYHKLQKPNVNVFFIDTIKFANEPEQRQWLTQGLASSTAPFNLVCGHYPIYSNGANGDNQGLIDTLLPLLNKHLGNTFYVSGHDHNLEHLVAPSGLNQIVCGSGAYTRPMEGTGLSKFQASVTGFSYLEFSQTQAKITFVDSNQRALYKTTLLST